ncbi:MAG: DUF977 family protein [Candidatus Helarchaeota archaeon]
MLDLKTEQIKSIAMIGFDTLKGPVVEWRKNLANDFEVDIHQFCTSFYLMFQSGNGVKPRAIFFDKFYVIAFPDDMNLLLLFLDAAQQNYEALLKFARNHYPKNYRKKPQEKTAKDEMLDVLRAQQKMTISELKEFFKFNRKTMRRYLYDLVASGKIKRDGKKGRETVWAFIFE